MLAYQSRNIRCFFWEYLPNFSNIKLAYPLWFLILVFVINLFIIIPILSGLIIYHLAYFLKKCIETDAFFIYLDTLRVSFSEVLDEFTRPTLHMVLQTLSHILARAVAFQQINQRIDLIELQVVRLFCWILNPWCEILGYRLDDCTIGFLNKWPPLLLRRLPHQITQAPAGFPRNLLAVRLDG